MVRRELGLWKRLLCEAPLLGLLVLALLAGTGAYQVQRPEFLDVGGGYDTPYLAHFHEQETGRSESSGPQVGFRWTRGESEIRLLGLGRQDVSLALRMQGFRPAGRPPNVSLLASGVPLASFAVGPGWQVYRVLIPRHLLPAGDLHLELRSDTFRPPDDPRELGVAVDWVEVQPQEVGWVWPAWGQIGFLLVATLLAYLALRRWGAAQVWSGAAAGAGVALLAYLLAFHRLSLTCFSSRLALLLAAGLGLTVAVLPALEWRLERREGTRPGPAPTEEAPCSVPGVRVLFAVLLVGALLRLGGMFYPQFRTSDLTFHVHRLEMALEGSLYFTGGLPDLNIAAPYPPGPYLSMALLALFSPDRHLVMKTVGVGLDLLAGFLLYLLARRLSGRHDVALAALLLQEAAPITFMALSWGIYANLFTRVALLGVLSMLCLGRWEWGRGWVLLSATMGLVLLGHFADSVLLVVYVLVMAVLGLLLPGSGRPALRMVAALLAAGALALLLYYTAPATWQTLLQDVKALAQGRGRPAGLSNPLTQFLAHLQPALALLGLPGLVLLWRTGPSWRWPGLALGGVLLTALVFALAQVLLGITSRYSLFVLPVLALGTGMMLVSWRRRGWAGRLAAAVLLGYVVLAGAIAWGRQIASYLH